MANYCPVSNLTILSKVIEWVVLDQLYKVLEENMIILVLRSACRQLHSTKNALCKIYNDLVISARQGQSSLLIFIDMSPVFDTLDHGILI